MINLTQDELTIIKSRLPFGDMPAGAERLQAISDFMRAAEKLYRHGVEAFLNRITAMDNDGYDVEVMYEEGDPSAGIQPGGAWTA